jgi:hypothetical protein
MNKHRASTTAPAGPALVAAEESRPESHPLDAVLSALALLLAALFGATPGTALARAIAAQALTLLRAWFRPGPRAATPEQHARARTPPAPCPTRPSRAPPACIPRPTPAHPRPKSPPNPHRIRTPIERNVITF